MDPRDFEFIITQYLDGTLPATERTAVEERLRNDPAGRAMLEEYRQLDAALAGATTQLPAIHWDRFAEHLSQAVAGHVEHRGYSIRFYRVAAALALAAAVLVAVGIFAPWNRHATVTPPVAVNNNNTSPATELIVMGPQPEVAAGPAVLDISIGRPQEAETAMAYTSDSILVQRPTVALDGFTQSGAGEIR